MTGREFQVIVTGDVKIWSINAQLPMPEEANLSIWESRLKCRLYEILKRAENEWQEELETLAKANL